MNKNFFKFLNDNYEINETNSGTEFKLSGECPFCLKDRHDLRLYINKETGRGYCHHCSTGFTPIDFIMAHDNISYYEAFNVLYSGIESFPFAKKKEDRLASRMWFPNIIALNNRAVTYLISRNVSLEAITHFKLAFCDTDTVNNSRRYSTSDRIIFPISDMNKNIVAWQGRDITGTRKNKYLFPSGFAGAEYLYNIENIDNNCEYLIICEGIMDVIGWWQSGFKNAVATFGKKISKQQLELIKIKNPKKVLMAWDSDADWQKHEFCEANCDILDVRIIDMNGMDADEMTCADLIDVFKSAQTERWEDKIINLLA